MIRHVVVDGKDGWQLDSGEVFFYDPENQRSRVRAFADAVNADQAAQKEPPSR